MPGSVTFAPLTMVGDPKVAACAPVAAAVAVIAAHSATAAERRRQDLIEVMFASLSETIQWTEREAAPLASMRFRGCAPLGAPALPLRGERLYTVDWWYDVAFL